MRNIELHTTLAICPSYPAFESKSWVKDGVCMIV